METCHYNFKWKTASACSEQALHAKSLEHNLDCAVRDPQTNYLYNLTALKNKEYNVTLFGTTEVFRFSICGPIANTHCEKGSGKWKAFLFLVKYSLAHFFLHIVCTGACRLHNYTSGGMGNSKLMWKETGPYLNYTDGSLCRYHQHPRYTIIEFYCGPEEYEINENDLCYDEIKVNTELVCDKPVRIYIIICKYIRVNNFILKFNCFGFSEGNVHDNFSRTNAVKEQLRSENRRCRVPHQPLPLPQSREGPELR